MIVTREQAELGPLYRDKWIAKALSTEPVNRPLAEKRFAALYESVNLKPPIVRWFTSPIKGATEAVRTSLCERRPTITQHIFTDVLERISVEGRESRNWQFKLELQMDEAVNATSNLQRLLHKMLFQSVFLRSGPVAEVISDELHLRASVLENESSLEDKVDDAISGTLSGIRKTGRVLSYLAEHIVYGSLDSHCFAAYDYGTRVLGEPRCADVDALIDATSEVGCYWPFEHVVIACERPRVMLFDNDGRLHSSRAYAIAWTDAFGICCHHGVRVPREALSNEGVDWKDLEVTADKKVQSAIVEIKAEKWSVSKKVFDKKETAEHREAALAVERLGGIPALKDLIEGD